MAPIRLSAPSPCRLSTITSHISPSISSQQIPNTTTIAATIATTTITTTPLRAFSTTPPTPRQKPSHLTVPTDQVPAYPYGRFRTYKQANEGLFAGSKIRFGNVVAPDHGNKSRTTWLPNRHTKRLWSASLGAFVRTRLTTGVLKTVDRLGGIDEYLLGSKARRIKDLGPAGWALRWKIMQTPAVRERFARERAALGLPPKEEDDGRGETLPGELVADGVTSEAVLSEVDGMLERGDEFVIGEVKDGEELLIKEDGEAIGEARETGETGETTEDVKDAIEEEKPSGDDKAPKV
ncbi:54S ribosomal protein L24, mitochondrial [Daldinia childiae]|uniref:54S ribosomal protein L24, mitochondrial n=1 Tax=Daldinia childiae TaxID=326645 RepID=UPI0014458958|nr:54S ribosomal protein L24, mitochondrial [Daldinia childiae]KAF3070742.1 54S ribosomal protein L24, mitochondrial [Daldinia childiae]